MKIIAKDYLKHKKDNYRRVAVFGGQTCVTTVRRTLFLVGFTS
ncbi:hypothetical protein [Lactobacillus amylovorus]|nr:hypothetical protein [Lactobacillus amylovorus]